MMKVRSLEISNSKQTLIKNLNLTMSKGEFWAIIGRNGYGKSTLLHTLAGMNPYSQGTIQLQGLSLNSLKPLIRAQKISLLSQLMEPGLNCTVRQTVSYGRYPWQKYKLDFAKDEQKIGEALQSMQISGIQHEMIQQISGGELRKVEIATILAQDAEIMMLDEPLNHLDVAFRIHLMNVLKKLTKKKLIIIVTHDIQYVKNYCSHVLMLTGDGDYKCGKTGTVLNQENLESLLGTKITEIKF